MLRWHCMLAVALGVHALAAAAPDTPSARARHVSDCVAALKTGTETLAEKTRAGHPELKPELLARLEQGGAFIGDSYLDGNRDEKASKAMLDAATRAQRSLPPDALASLQLACSKEGADLLAAANAFNRALVRQVAKRRMAKLLEPAAP